MIYNNLVNLFHEKDAWKGKLSMRYIGALLIKFLITLLSLWIVLGFIYGVSFSPIFLISMIVTVVTFIGDVLILPRISQSAAIFTDLLLYWAVLWISSAAIIEGMIGFGSASFLSAVVLTLTEIYFHRYMLDDVIRPKRGEIFYFPSHRFQTESSEEITPNNDDNDDDK